MMAAAPSFTPIADRRLLDRDDAICDTLRSVVMGLVLSPQAESDIWVAARQRIEAVLHLADGATVARVEAEATERRIVTHLHTHYGCTPDDPCGALRLLGFREKRLREKADRAYRELARARR
jgi:hypothetical protein